MSRSHAPQKRGLFRKMGLIFDFLDFKIFIKKKDNEEAVIEFKFCYKHHHVKSNNLQQLLVYFILLYLYILLLFILFYII